MDEIKTAIFTSSTKKALGPDRISFKIVQEAFLAIPDLFYRVYSTLIDRGYHPKQWREAIGVILKKSGKRDETVPKTYRVISLLNCLGKTAEKIIANRLSYLAENTDLLYPEQIGGRIQKSAIDAALALTHDIELARNRGLKSSALLLDIKGAFDHVSKNQLLGFCQRLKLPISICNWIESFISDRSIRLVFDGESTEKTKIETGIPQGSPVSPILFLIYIRFLFEEIDVEEEGLELSMPSYMDDITIRVSTIDLENNCRILQKIANKLIEWGLLNCIEFDKDKTELIHFYKGQYIEGNTVTISDNLTITPKTEVKWLGVWFDRTLSFKPHVDRMLAKANRVYNQIYRLANCSKGLSFQAMRQLYMACITSIADFGVPIWWKGQRHYLERYEKLQNSMLRKILGAFKTSPIAAMEIAAAILPTGLRLDKICQNYALRAIQLNQEHPIKRRCPESFPNSGSDNIDLDWDRYLDWNQIDQSKRYPTQLYRVLNSVATAIPSLNIEETGFLKQAPWLVNPIDYSGNDNTKDKDELVKQYSEFLKDTDLEACLIGYTDGSKLDNQESGAGLNLIDKTTVLEEREEYSWHLGPSMEVYDAELFAISQAIKRGLSIIKKKNIRKSKFYIFSDSKAAIDRLKKHQDIGPGYNIVRQCIQTANQLASLGTEIAIKWIPSHANIPGNETADELAKKAAKSQSNPVKKVSLTNIRKRLNQTTIDRWNNQWQQNTTKGRHYSQFTASIKRKTCKIFTDRRTWTAYIQLKLGHGYFRSYLSRISQDINTDRCVGIC